MKRFLEEMKEVYPEPLANHDSTIRSYNTDIEQNPLERAKDAYKSGHIVPALHILCNALKDFDTSEYSTIHHQTEDMENT